MHACIPAGLICNGAEILAAGVRHNDSGGTMSGFLLLGNGFMRKGFYDVFTAERKGVRVSQTSFLLGRINQICV